jgi:hypothetical protein
MSVRLIQALQAPKSQGQLNMWFHFLFTSDSSFACASLLLPEYRLIFASTKPHSCDLQHITTSTGSSPLLCVDDVVLEVASLDIALKHDVDFLVCPAFQFRHSKI